MWLRRAFFGWLFPSAFLLPLWLFIGWGVFNAGAWAFLWVLFVAIPAVFVGQLVLTLLVRARGTVRTQRAVSWWDVIGFTLWHGLTISLGFFGHDWWAPVFVLTVVVALALFWLEIWQLLSESRQGTMLMRASNGIGYLRPQPRPAKATAGARDIYVIAEEERLR